MIVLMGWGGALGYALNHFLLHPWNFYVKHQDTHIQRENV